MQISKQAIEVAHKRIHKYIRRTPSIVSGNGTFGLKYSISLNWNICNTQVPLKHVVHSTHY